MIAQLKPNNTLICLRYVLSVSAIKKKQYTVHTQGYFKTIKKYKIKKLFHKTNLSCNSIFHKSAD